jgi:hypothetical protein
VLGIEFGIGYFAEFTEFQQGFQIRNHGLNLFKGLSPDFDGLDFLYFLLGFFGIVPEIGREGGALALGYFLFLMIVVKDSPSVLRGDSEVTSAGLGS